MKKFFKYSILIGLLFVFLAVSAHKYHMAIYQIEYASEKKMLQITARIHIDDLNKAFEKKYKNKIYIGDENEEPEELRLLLEYLAANFSVKVNNQLKTMNFRSQETQGDELVCYWNIKGISKINTVQIDNKILVEVYADQQNRITVTAMGTKNSFTLNSTITSNSIKY
jgi:hypothetical protein